MTRISYMKDTKKFWQEHESARAELDTKRSHATSSQKNATARKIRSDVRFLQRGKIV